MTDEELREKKIHLMHCELQKEETDITLAEMEHMLDRDIPTRLLKDDIEKVKEDIKTKFLYDQFGNKVDATEADIARLKITLKKFEKQLKLGLPNKTLRFKINQLRDAKCRIDAPELQIKKLKKEIREKAYSSIARGTSPDMIA